MTEQCGSIKSSFLTADTSHVFGELLPWVLSKADFELPTEVNLLINAPWVKAPSFLSLPVSLPFSPSGAFDTFTSQINLLAVKPLCQGLFLAQSNPRPNSVTKHDQINLGTEQS